MKLPELARRLYRGAPTLRRSMQYYRPYIAPFDDLINLVRPGSSVLDVGCGPGLFLGLLAASGRIVQGQGIDSSTDAIAMACEMRAQLDYPGIVSFERRDATAGLPAGRFDVVSLIDVIHHVSPDSQRELFVAALRRVGDGGSLLYKDIALTPAWRAWANRLHDLLLARQWIHYAPLQEVIEWARECGFEAVTKRTRVMLWYGHEIVEFRRAPKTSVPGTY